MTVLCFGWASWLMCNVQDFYKQFCNKILIYIFNRQRQWTRPQTEIWPNCWIEFYVTPVRTELGPFRSPGPPFSLNIETNVGKEIFKIIDNSFIKMLIIAWRNLVLFQKYFLICAYFSQLIRRHIANKITIYHCL